MELLKYSVYILQSQRNGRFYVGISKNPSHRLEIHNSIEKGFTARFRPWELVFEYQLENKEIAMRVEKFIK